MDELFLLPPCPVAIPRAYWLTDTLSSQLVLLQPDAVEFERVSEKINSAGGSEYDMDIFNELYGDSAMILPHRPYNVLTAEWRSTNHEPYLGSDREEWNPSAVLGGARFVHFSDWPVPKPWLPTPAGILAEKQPACRTIGDVEDCTERLIWNGFYDEFRNLRKVSFSLEIGGLVVGEVCWLTLTPRVIKGVCESGGNQLR